MDIQKIEKLAAKIQEQTGQDSKNIKTVLVEFCARGVDLKQIKPNVNVLTYKKWRDKGRQVRKGEHGVKIIVMIENSDNKKANRVPRKTTVFHISQTDPIVSE
jgi:antirestriction protein ArdC